MTAGYRPDVDGLRGLAIALVVAFHFFPSVLPGGFVGVDVFFVISGYLITSQLEASLAAQRFSFRDFYARRFRRLLPALLLVVGVCLVAGFDVLMPTEFERLGKHALGALTYSSNVVLWSEGGYFDAPALSKPLHHLWSLGVEEQYYAVWPLCLWGCARWPRSARLGFLALLFAASFGANLVLTMEDPAGAFFMPMGRLWELGAGGVVAFKVLPALPRWFGDALGLLGLLVIIVSSVLIDSSGFLGLVVLAPVLSAVALLLTADGSVMRRVLSFRPLVGLGTVSYALYLWHWPVLIFTRFTEGPGEHFPLGVGSSVVAIVVSLVASVATVRWVEAPIRFARRVSVPTLLITSLVMGVVAVGIWAALVPSRNQQTVRAEFWVPSKALEAFDVKGVTFHRSGERPSVAFVGDSNMDQYLPAVEPRAHDATSRPFMVVTKGGCSVVLDTGRGCRPFAEAAHQVLADPTISTVVFSSQWQLYFENPRYHDGHSLPVDGPEADRSFEAFNQWLRTLGATKRVVVVLSAPSSKRFDPVLTLQRSWWRGATLGVTSQPRAQLDLERTPVISRVRAVALDAGATLIDPFDTFCDAEWCPAVNDAGVPMYIDEWHLAPAAVAERFHALDALIELSSGRDAGR